MADAVNEINRIVNDDSLSALQKIAALDELYDDLHTKLAEIVGPDKAAEMLEPFDKLIEQAKNDVAKAAAAAADTLIKEALKAVKAAVDSAESKEDAINKMEAIYSQAHDLLTRAGMSDEDATAKLAPVRSALDSLKRCWRIPSSPWTPSRRLWTSSWTQQWPVTASRAAFTSWCARCWTATMWTRP